eukprot:2921312-Prymnesium_polylepis.1
MASHIARAARSRRSVLHPRRAPHERLVSPSPQAATRHGPPPPMVRSAGLTRWASRSPLADRADAPPRRRSERG